jgi:hypothetical protein
LALPGLGPGESLEGHVKNLTQTQGFWAFKTLVRQESEGAAAPLGRVAARCAGAAVAFATGMAGLPASVCHE